MKKIVFAIFLIAVWALGIYEGNCSFAVGLSIIPICAGLEVAIASIVWQIHKRKTN